MVRSLRISETERRSCTGGIPSWILKALLSARRSHHHSARSASASAGAFASTQAPTPYTFSLIAVITLGACGQNQAKQSGSVCDLPKISIPQRHARETSESISSANTSVPRHSPSRLTQMASLRDHEAGAQPAIKGTPKMASPPAGTPKP